MKENFHDKKIIKNLTREGKSLAFYAIMNKAKTLNKP
jgi:hypothetical protein